MSARGCGRRRGWAASSGRDLGGSGRSGRREGWTAVSFPVGPYRRRVPSLASAAGWHDRLYSAVLLFSLSTPAPCCQLPLFPGGREAWLCSESVLNKTKTGSVTRTSSDRLLGPLLAELALGDRAPECRGGARGERRGSARLRTRRPHRPRRAARRPPGPPRCTRAFLFRQ